MNKANQWGLAMAKQFEKGPDDIRYDVSKSGFIRGIKTISSEPTA